MTNQPLTYQVRVHTAGMGSAHTVAHVHLVDVLADSPTQAMLVATQMAACRIDLLGSGQTNVNLMPLHAEVVTDSSVW